MSTWTKHKVKGTIISPNNHPQTIQTRSRRAAHAPRCCSGDRDENKTVFIQFASDRPSARCFFSFSVTSCAFFLCYFCFRNTRPNGTDNWLCRLKTQDHCDLGLTGDIQVRVRRTIVETPADWFQEMSRWSVNTGQWKTACVLWFFVPFNISTRYLKLTDLNVVEGTEQCHTSYYCYCSL